MIVQQFIEVILRNLYTLDAYTSHNEYGNDLYDATRINKTSVIDDQN